MKLLVLLSSQKSCAHLTFASIAIEDSFLSSKIGGYGATVGVQHYIRERTAVRLRLSGTQLGDSGPALDGQTRGLALSAGASYSPSLGARRRFLRWAAFIDAELAFGPNVQTVLAPIVLTDLRITSGAAGLAATIGPEVVPVAVHARYVHAGVQSGADVGYLDIGVGLSTDLRWLQLPLGVHLAYRFSEELTGGDYRAYEFGGGAFYEHSRKFRVGLDSGVAFVRLGPNLQTRMIRVVARAAWYWDANE